METDFGCFFLFEQMQSKAPQGGEVLIRVPLPDAAVILPKRNIQDPVQAVFNAPMTPNGRTELRRIVAGQAAQVVTALDTGVLTDSTLCFTSPKLRRPGHCSRSANQSMALVDQTRRTSMRP